MQAASKPLCPKMDRAHQDATHWTDNASKQDHRFHTHCRRPTTTTRMDTLRPTRGWRSASCRPHLACASSTARASAPAPPRPSASNDERPGTASRLQTPVCCSSKRSSGCVRTTTSTTTNTTTRIIISTSTGSSSSRARAAAVPLLLHALSHNRTAPAAMPLLEVPVAAANRGGTASVLAQDEWAAGHSGRAHCAAYC